MPFTNWLLQQTYRDDIVGDLARDASMDTTRPQNGIRRWRHHLIVIRESDLAHLALERAWEEYKVATLLRFTKKLN
jgi:hypothetical protein